LSGLVYTHKSLLAGGVNLGHCLGSFLRLGREELDELPGFECFVYEWGHHRTLVGVRDLNERFASRALPLFKRQTKEAELLPAVYAGE
jgi:hypothetical protein